MNEIWKKIPNYPDYEVSNLGNIKSYKGKTPKLLKINYYPNGYTFVTLRNNNKNKNFLIHRLVLSVFKPQENEEELQVNHINCIRDDNTLNNLEWVTPKQNRNYREQLHHTPKSQKILVKFLDDREDMIFNTMTECADYFGITRKAISNYLKSKTIRNDRKVQAYFYRID